jgi:hypothetical protein
VFSVALKMSVLHLNELLMKKINFISKGLNTKFLEYKNMRNTVFIPYEKYKKKNNLAKEEIKSDLKNNP